MRLTTFGLFVVALIAFASASPAKSQKNNACSRDCFGTEALVCAIDGSGKPLLFGNPCTLEKFNCEHTDKKYVQTDISKCPPGTSTRLN